MSYGSDLFGPRGCTVADQASRDERAAFITRTYAHLFGAVVAFVAIEFVLLQMPFTPRLVAVMLTGARGYSWLIVLGAFMLVSHVATRWAHSTTALSTQYLGLGIYVVAEAVIFLAHPVFAYFCGINHPTNSYLVSCRA